MNLGLAFKVFFKVLGDAAFSGRVRGLLEHPGKRESEDPTPQRPVRSDAVELLAALQREGRLIDFFQEKLEAYSDAQVGAAVRDIHRDCRQTVDRMFGIVPAQDLAEGSAVIVPEQADPGAWKLIGEVSADKRSGVVRHQGWKVTRCELPTWTGTPAAAGIVHPTEVELS